MKKISNSSLVSVFIKLLIIVIITKAISVFVLWYLPNDGIELKAKNSFTPSYSRINFSNMIKNPKPKEVQKPKSTSVEVSITSMVLKGLYGLNKKGYIIVAMKAKPKDTSIIGVGEEYQGYKLVLLQKNGAEFIKAGKKYVLEFDKIKKDKYVKPVEKKSKKKNMSSVPAVPNMVSKKDVSYYAKNPAAIWKDISISEVKKDNKIIGFKVNRIKARSKFAMLGLKKGDLIIKANNVKLDSYRAAMDIYNNIDKIDAVEIVVLRNNQEVELVYEIN